MLPTLNAESSLAPRVNRYATSGSGRSAAASVALVPQLRRPMMARPGLTGGFGGPTLGISEGCVAACSISCAGACIGACFWNPFGSACSECTTACMDMCARNC